jgi:MFS family permease
MNTQHKLFNKNLVLLIVCQGIFLTNNVTFIAINGLVGLSLTNIAWIATLPIMGYVVGGALATSIVAKYQKKLGRKKSFQTGLIVAILSSLVCAYAAYSKNFWILVAGTVFAGYYSANGQLYRFAAAELTHASLREKAVSWVLAGGILGAVIGPNLANWTRNSFDTPFLGAYLTLTVAGFLGLAVMHFIQFPDETEVKKDLPPGRPLSEILRQPVFVVAVIGSALGYGVMNMLMAATPLGVVLNIVCIGIALMGVDVYHFLLASFILGVGWNFLFTSATTLALTAYRPEEKDKAQGAINFFVFTTMAITSFGSGALVTTNGWSFLNAGSLVPVVITGAALFWLTRAKKKTA